MSQWMGNLFYRRQSIQVIKDLRYAEMKYWNTWHEIMEKQQQEINDKIAGKK